MSTIKSVLFLSIIFVLSACSKESVTKAELDKGVMDSNPTQIKNTDLKIPDPVIANTLPLEDGIVVSVIAPEYSSGTSKEILLHDFTRTLETTNLSLKIKAINPALLDETTTYTLLGQGFTLDEKNVKLKANQNTLQLYFRTPRLSSQGQEDGVQSITYELLISNSKRETRLPFTLKIYNARNSSLIVPRNTACSIYYKPEPASGCLQNRTRTTQEIVFADDVTVGNESSVTFSGGISLGISIVSAQFGAEKAKTSSQSTSQGSEIHFTNCIECSSMVFRQKVETIRKGDVYRVLADGSLQWAGDVNFSTKALSYEFTSTGSESRNYTCNFESQLPIGRTPSCDEIAKP